MISRERAFNLALGTTLGVVLVWFFIFCIEDAHILVQGMILVALILSLASVILWSIYLMQRLSGKLSNYVYFAIGDLAVMLAVLVYSIYDILASVGFLGGLTGMALLIYLEPVLLIFEISAVVAYLKKKNAV